jgi:Tol biopolymer transport system component
VWYARSGTRGATVGEPARYTTLELSPDGGKAAVTVVDPVSTLNQVWMLDLVRGIPTRFTFGDSDNIWAVWSPDGSRVLFHSTRSGGNLAVFQKAADGTGETKLIKKIEGVSFGCVDWSPDGETLICAESDPKSGNLDLLLVPLSPDAETQRLTDTPFTEGWAQISPDGRWLAYGSDESGVYEIYVRPFSLSAGKWQVSTAGGTKPRWGPDGRELFFLAPDSTLMAAQLEPSRTSLTVTRVEPLFKADFAELSAAYPYDVSPDGERFLVIVEPDEAASSPITLVINWTADLER